MPKKKSYYGERPDVYESPLSTPARLTGRTLTTFSAIILLQLVAPIDIKNSKFLGLAFETNQAATFNLIEAALGIALLYLLTQFLIFVIHEWARIVSREFKDIGAYSPDPVTQINLLYDEFENLKRGLNSHENALDQAGQNFKHAAEIYKVATEQAKETGALINSSDLLSIQANAMENRRAIDYLELKRQKLADLPAFIDQLVNEAKKNHKNLYRIWLNIYFINRSSSLLHSFRTLVLEVVLPISLSLLALYVSIEGSLALLRSVYKELLL